MELHVGEKPSSIKDYYRENLGSVFEHYFAEVINTKKDDQINILSVGCGFGYEAEPLLRIFPNATYTGIDIDNDLISGAERVNRDLHGRYQFQVADARNKDSFGTKPWDIVIIRNPQVMGNVSDASGGNNTRKNWYEIIINSIEVLEEEGSVFVAVDSEHERNIVLEYLNSLTDKISIVVNELNRSPSSKGVFLDRFVIVANKTGER